MLIQNTSSVTQAPTPAGHASNGGPGSVAVHVQEARAEVKPAVAQQPSPAQLESEVGKINSALQRSNRNLELSISVDESTKKQVIKLTDKETGDTLMQYPSDTVLAIARSIDDFQHGQLLKQQA
ncbi:MAG: flagellar protein FlaG [Nitrosomonadales bacterium]|nr:flagellar protein FlaG [Nitrosomonadales bacterium]